MDTTLIYTGLACIIAAIVGGGMRAFGVEIPILASTKRQLLLAAFGLILIGSSVSKSLLHQWRDEALWTDPLTGWMWTRKMSSSFETFDAAVWFCKSGHFGNYTDWRLPTDYDVERLITGATLEESMANPKKGSRSLKDLPQYPPTHLWVQRNGGSKLMEVDINQGSFLLWPADHYDGSQGVALKTGVALCVRNVSNQ